MEPRRPDDSPAEVLSTGRPPGTLERWAGSLWAQRSFRAVTTAVLLSLVIVAWLVFSSDEPAARPAEDAATSAVSAPGLRPVPPRGRADGVSTWELPEDVDIRSGPRGHTVTFHTTNQGQQPAWPSNLRVDARFLDRQGLIYQARCSGIRRTSHGPEVVDGAVAPGTEVFVRCRDITHYGGPPARIAPWTVHVTVMPCQEESGRGSGV